MTTRRNFIKTSGLVTGGIALSGTSGFGISRENTFSSRRPPLKDRKFVSEAVEETIRLTLPANGLPGPIPCSAN